MTKVLIVDDLSSIREFLKINLSSEPDIEVVGLADNGRGAVTQVEEHQPDIILMDINMPGAIDGIEATEKIVNRYPQCKVLLLTSQDDRQQLDRALKAGSRGYILKNTSIKDIANIIRLAERGFFQIGPMIGSWDGSLHNSVQASANKLAVGGRGLEQAEPIIPHQFDPRSEQAPSNAGAFRQRKALAADSSPHGGVISDYPARANRSPEVNNSLSNLSSELFQLQETIKSQEDTIVNLTHQYSQVQREISSKLRRGRTSSNSGFTIYGSRTSKSRTLKQQHLLFISSFLLGVITVLFLVLLIMAVG